MTAQTFARQAGQDPTPNPAPLHSYICHMAALHWAFRDLGDTDAVAAARIEAICVAKCPGCQQGAPALINFPHDWYGAQLCADANALADRAALKSDGTLGDVLSVGSSAQPAHSMVVVDVKNRIGRKWIHIRGFNNTGTLGKGPKLAYDASNRDVHKGKYFHARSGQPTRFGLSYSSGGQLHRVSYADYIAAATTVRNNVDVAGGTYTYTGP